jgi:hypothetical protein
MHYRTPNSVLIVSGIVALLVLLPAAYMGAYYAMLAPVHCYRMGCSHQKAESIAVYRGKFDSLSAVVFKPANRLDRILRPSRWDVE